MTCICLMGVKIMNTIEDWSIRTLDLYTLFVNQAVENWNDVTSKVFIIMETDYTGPYTLGIFAISNIAISHPVIHTASNFWILEAECKMVILPATTAHAWWLVWMHHAQAAQNAVFTSSQHHNCHNAQCAQLVHTCTEFQESHMYYRDIRAVSFHTCNFALTSRY